MGTILGKLKKIAMWVGIVLVALILAAVLILPKIFPVTAVANYAAGKVGEQIGRTISIQKASFNPFKGLSLRGVVISNDAKFSSRPMIDIKEVVLSYELLPLIFKRQVVVNKAGVSGLALLYEKRGALNNFASLSSKKAGVPVPQKKVEDKVAAKKEPKKPSEPISMSIGKIYIEKSVIEYIDYRASGEKKLTIEDLNIALSNLSNDLAYSPANLKGHVKISGGGNVSVIDLNGKITGTKAANLELKIDKLAMDKLLSVFSDVKPKGDKKKTEAEKAAPPQELRIDFSPLKGFNIDFLASLGEFTYGRMKATSIKFKMGLHDMLLTLDHDTALYSGMVKGKENATLSAVPAPFAVVATVKKIDGKKFMDEGLDMEDTVEGLLSAEVDVKGKLNYPTKLTGSVKATFENGKIINAAKLLPGVPEALLKDLNGKVFDILVVGLSLDDGKPSVGSLKAKGKNLDIDWNINLNIDQLKEQAQQQVQQKLDEGTRAVQQAVDEKKKEAELKVQEELQDKLKGLIPQ